MGPPLGLIAARLHSGSLAGRLQLVACEPRIGSNDADEKLASGIVFPNDLVALDPAVLRGFVDRLSERRKQQMHSTY